MNLMRPIPLINLIMKLLIKDIRFIKYFSIVCCATSMLGLLWITKDNHIYRYAYRIIEVPTKELKFILLWTQRDYAPLNFFEDSQKSFIKNNCSFVNCFVTANKMLFGSDITKFDAVAFNGRNMKPNSYPHKRSSSQKYIYFNMESADHYPHCHKKYDDFFNLTATYKLNSDIRLPYILIKDRNGQIVGPKTKMQWKVNSAGGDGEYSARIENKTKAAAWFVSNCNSRSGRESFVKNLQNALTSYGLNIDIYGKCGTFHCARDKGVECGHYLEKDYFFYMSLENSFADDYVTEKLLTALHHDVVPIVFGGADYSKFLPPGSYIDGRKQNASQLAATMNRLMHNPQEYLQFFRWKEYYTYHDPLTMENVCGLCEALNNDDLMRKNTVYRHFRAWWNPDFKKRCNVND